MCCVGRKKITGKKVTIYFFHIYFPPESHSVYIYFCFFLLFWRFVLFFLYLFVCFLFCFDIYSRPWLRTKFDWCLIDMYSIPTPSNYKGVKITAVSIQIGHFLSTFVLQEVEETHNLKMYMVLSMNLTF